MPTSQSDDLTKPLPGPHPGALFMNTRWSVVLAAGRSDTTRARKALAHLCSAYWYPLYAYVRRRGHSKPDAQDLTQGFFAHLLETDLLGGADPQRGRFRSFLLTSLKHYLINEWKKGRADKRGGGCEIISLDWAAAENRLDLDPADPAVSDQTFDKEWALTVLDEVLRRLEKEHQNEGRQDFFAVLKDTLQGSREVQPYAQLAARLDMNEGAVRVAVHRLRKRYREIIREEIAQTVGSSHDVDAEMRHLFKALSQ